MLTIEQEFEIAKSKHKIKILGTKIKNYYTNIQQGEVNLPNFMRNDSPEKLTNRDIKNLILTDINKFNSLYEKAWCEDAPIYP